MGAELPARPSTRGVASAITIGGEAGGLRCRRHNDGSRTGSADRARPERGHRRSLASATPPGGAAAAKKKSQAITIAVDEFPPVLNDMTTTGNGEWTAMIAGPALARGYKLLPDFSYEPWIFDKDCTVTGQSPFTVDCTIRPTPSGPTACRSPPPTSSSPTTRS